MNTIKVVIVDDHTMFRMGLMASFRYGYPDICIVGEAADAKELFALPVLSTADIVLLDINLPDMHGTNVARRLHKEHPNLKILALSAEINEQTIQSMVDAGINGFISKQMGDLDELAHAIRTIISGIEYFGQDVASIIYSIYVAKKKTTTITNEFTEREREIILLCHNGLMCKEIADHLNISTRTVNTHKERIFQKLGINTTMEMVRYALKNKIIKVED